MPLLKGKSESVIGKNVSELHGGKTYEHTANKFGKKRADKQAVAIAMRKAGKSKKKRARKLPAHLRGRGMISAKAHAAMGDE